MTKASVTYKALDGDDAETEVHGVKFADGKAVELDTAEHANLITMLRTHPLFKVSGKDDTAPGVEPRQENRAFGQVVPDDKPNLKVSGRDDPAPVEPRQEGGRFGSEVPDGDKQVKEWGKAFNPSKPESERGLTTKPKPDHTPAKRK